MKTNGRTKQNNFRRLGMAAIAGLLLATGWSNIATAQRDGGISRTGFERNESRRFNTDDLINRLIGSQGESRDIQDRTRRFHNNSNTGGIGIQATEISQRDLRRARQLLSDFARESSTLTNAIDDERYRIPAVRPYFSDALKIRARAFYVSQQADKTENARQLSQDFSEVDQDFRLLSSRLRQVRGLSRKVATPVIAMERLDKEITDLLKIRPQLDYSKLSRQSAILSTGFRSLLEDIEFEMPRSSERTQLLIDGRRLYQQAEYLSSTTLDRSSHENISREYKSFEKMWKPYDARLRRVNNRYVERTVRRINQADRDVRELLWLPHQVDRTELLYLTKALMKDVDEFFDRAPLKMLINLPNTSSVLADSSEFYGVCENFEANVIGGENQVDLIDDFSYIEESFRTFSTTFHNVKSQKAETVLHDIESRIQSLRSELKVQDDYFDKNAALQLAAAIDNLASRMNTDVDRWIGNSNSATARQARRDSTAFVEAARRLHLDINNDANVSDISRQADRLFEMWGTLHTYIPKADGQTRLAMQRTSARMTPYLVDLQTMLGSQRGVRTRTNVNPR